MIALAEYLGPHADHPDATSEIRGTAARMLDKVNLLLIEAEENGVELEMNPKTGTLVSGQTYGGFRPQDCPQGAPQSAHKLGRAVDIYDPHGYLDRWITDLMLEKHGLFREHPADTAGWCHLSDKAPGSGRRTFHP